MSIFNFYPYVNYNNTKATHLLVEGDLVDRYMSDYRTFFSYTVKDSERADQIAYRQYGDASYDWVVYLINNITDPYKDWVMEDKQFIAYLEKKYGVPAYSLTGQVQYYYYTGLPSDTQGEINSYNYTITPTTYQLMGSPSGWTAKSVFDYESEINESKRNIKLLRASYINDFTIQFKELFNNG